MPMLFSTTDVINKLAAVDVKFAVSADDLVNALLELEPWLKRLA